MSEPKVGRQVLILAGSLLATTPLAVLVFFSIVYPWLALIPGGLLAVLYRISRKKPVLAGAMAWFCYCPYEWGMRLRILCSGECNIRVDLLLIYPFLLLISAAALFVFFRDRFVVDFS